MDDFFTNNHNRTIRVLPVGRNLDDLLPLLRQFPVELTDNAPQLVISHGGDGTLLGAERDYPGLPKLAIRDRRNNPKCPLHAERQLLEDFFAGKLVKHFLTKLTAVSPAGESLTAINDLVISREIRSSAIRYRLRLDEQLVQPQVVADSLVIATPFGSTGYFQSITHGAFSCGLGLAFNNNMDGIDFLVVPENSAIEITILRGPASLGGDNDPRQIKLADGDTVTITASPQKTPIFGLEAFRCRDCYLLRRDGTTTAK